jgi:hypothetical protein
MVVISIISDSENTLWTLALSLSSGKLGMNNLLYWGSYRSMFFLVLFEDDDKTSSLKLLFLECVLISWRALEEEEVVVVNNCH